MTSIQPYCPRHDKPFEEFIIETEEFRCRSGCVYKGKIDGYFLIKEVSANTSPMDLTHPFSD